MNRMAFSLPGSQRIKAKKACYAVEKIQIVTNLLLFLS